MKLTDKITTEAELLTVFKKLYPEYTHLNFNSYMASEGSKQQMLLPSSKDQVSFWCYRERMRFNQGVYESSDVLDQLNARYPIYAHLSLNDRQQVAYTPDRQSGMADRQVTTTIGRLLSKYLPLFTDDYIRDLADTHMAEVNVTVEWLEGQEIVDAYAGVKNAIPSSCMAGKSFAHQVSHVYNHPDIKMAILRDKEGNVNARCLVYHAGENDKRMIRCYGDGKLLKMLTKMGYVRGNWAGIKFDPLVIVPPEETGGRHITIHMPYLDANGGHSATVGSNIAYIDGKVWVLTARQQGAITREGYQLNMPGSNGTAKLQVIDSTRFLTEDVVLGGTVNKLELETDMEDIFYGGVRGVTAGENIPDDYVQARDYSRRFTNQQLADRKMWIAKHMCFRHTGDWNREWYVDNDATRLHLGYGKLSQVYYPGEDDWKLDMTRITVNGVMHNIKDEDTVFISGLGYQHKSVLTKDHRKLHANRSIGRAGFYHKDTPVLRTVSGAKIDLAYNDDIVKLSTGEYEFRRKVAVRGHSKLGVDLWLHRTTDIAEFTKSARFAELLLESLMSDHGSGDNLNRFNQTVGVYLNRPLEGADPEVWQDRSAVYLYDLDERSDLRRFIELVRTSRTTDEAVKVWLLPILTKYADGIDALEAKKQADRRELLGHEPYKTEDFDSGQRVRLARLKSLVPGAVYDMQDKYEQYLGEVFTIDYVASSGVVSLDEISGRFTIDMIEPLTEAEAAEDRGDDEDDIEQTFEAAPAEPVGAEEAMRAQPTNFVAAEEVVRFTPAVIDLAVNTVHTTSSASNWPWASSGATATSYQVWSTQDRVTIAIPIPEVPFAEAAPPAPIEPPTLQPVLQEPVQAVEAQPAEAEIADVPAQPLPASQEVNEAIELQEIHHD